VTFGDDRAACPLWPAQLFYFWLIMLAGVMVFRMDKHAKSDFQ